MPLCLHRHAVAIVAGASRQSGAVAAVAAGVVSSGAVYLANAFSPRFRKALGVSGKTALIITPVAGAFFLRSHLTVAAARADPDAFVAAAPNAHGSTTPAAPQTRLAFWQSASNAVYTHPFKSIMAMAAPTYAFIFARESTHPATASLPLSQRLIHTRVYGQMVAVLSTVSVMAFVKVLDADGGAYRLDGGRVVRGVAPQDRLQHWYADLEPVPEGKGAVKGREAAAARSAVSETKASEESVHDDGVGPLGYGLLVPLLYAPLLPLVRIGLRNRLAPERLTQLTLGLIGVALVHAGTVIFTDSSVAFRR
jgi:hypothetical protein